MPLRYPSSIPTRPAASEVSNTLKAYTRTPGSPAPAYHPSNTRQLLIHTSPYRRSQPEKPKSSASFGLQYYDLRPKGGTPVSAIRFQKNGREGVRINRLRIPKEVKEQENSADHSSKALENDERTLSTELELLTKASGLYTPEDERILQADLLEEKLHNLHFFDTDVGNSAQASNKPTARYHLFEEHFYLRRANELGDKFYRSIADDHNRMAHSANNDFLRLPSREENPSWLRRKAVNFHYQYLHISKKEKHNDIRWLIAEDLNAMMYWNNKKAMQGFFAQHNKDHPFVALRDGPDAAPFRYSNSSYPKIGHENLTFLTSFASDSDKLSSGPSHSDSIDLKQRLGSINLYGLLAKEAIMLLRAHLAQCRAAGVASTMVLNGDKISAAIRDMLPADLKDVTGGSGSYVLKLHLP